VKSDYLSDQQIHDAMLEPCHDIAETVAMLKQIYGPNATVCVLPQGPQTVPYISEVASPALV
jgi:hypothetical protein